MTLTVGVAEVVLLARDAATAEEMDARTVEGTEMTVEVRVLTQGRLPMMDWPYCLYPIGLDNVSMGGLRGGWREWEDVPAYGVQVDHVPVENLV